MIREGDLLWTPDAARIERAQLTLFMDWLARERGRRFDDYASLWRWSVQDLEGFWSALWEYFDIRASVPPARALGRRTMPGAEWFPGSRLNYAENVLSRARPGTEVLVYLSEGQAPASLSWDELAARVARLAAALRGLGIGSRNRGRVARRRRRNGNDHLQPAAGRGLRRGSASRRAGRSAR